MIVVVFFFCLAISFFAVRTFLHVLHISLLMWHCIYSAIQLSSCKCVFNKLSCQCQSRENLLHRISQCQNGARHGQGYYWSLIRSRMHALLSIGNKIDGLRWPWRAIVHSHAQNYPYGGTYHRRCSTRSLLIVNNYKVHVDIRGDPLEKEC